MRRTILSLGLAMLATAASAQRTATEIYASSCAACHGTRLQGGTGPSLLSETYRYGVSDAEVDRSIRVGHPQNGMPGWGEMLSNEEIASLVAMIRKQREESSPEYQRALDQRQKDLIAHSVVHSELQSFRFEILAEVGTSFGLAALPDGRLLVTEDAGALRIIGTDGKVSAPIIGVPQGKPKDIFKRGIIDVAVHPDYASNGWIYLTWADAAQDAERGSYTKVSLVRGRLLGMRWTDSETLLTIAGNSDTGRIALDNNGYVYMSTASEAGINAPQGAEPYSRERLASLPPQDIKSPLGKILRLHDDGRIPADNPFANEPGAGPTVWSLGHRVPQGLSYHAPTSSLWSTEHGPRGGDELNLIRRGANYGWPMISYGTRYDGLAFTTEIKADGLEQPIINWTPSIGVSAIAFYGGKQFPRWDGNLLVGSLIQEELYRMVIDGPTVKVRERLFGGLGRVRSIVVGRDGNVYIAFELRTHTVIARMVPVAAQQATK
jgi:glucose/arabinose dehydrogenase